MADTINLNNINLALHYYRKRKIFADENRHLIQADPVEIIQQYIFPPIGLSDEEDDILIDLLIKEKGL